MYLSRSVSWRALLGFGWGPFLILSSLSSFASVLDAVTDLTYSFLPAVTVIATPATIILAFHNRAAYERWWEARKIWGDIANVSRLWATQVTTYVRPPLVQEKEKALHAERSVRICQKELIYRHLAFVNALRLQLRRQKNWDEVRPFLPAGETAHFPIWKSPSVQIIRLNAFQLRFALDQGWIHSAQHTEMQHTLRLCNDYLGMCERIKFTPLNRHYSFFNRIFVYVFVFLLPFGVVEHMKWFTIPFATVVGWIFVSLEQAGRYIEDPFENHAHDVPMSSLCRKMEIDCRQMLGEAEIPVPLKPVKKVLM